MDVGSRVCMSMEDLRKTCWAVPQKSISHLSYEAMLSSD